MPKEKTKDEEIVNIYEEEEDSEEKVDMTKLERGTSNRKKKILISLVVFLFVLAGVSLGAFWLSNRDFQQGEGKVSFNLEAQDEVASGEMITLTLTYQNEERAALEQGEISVHYPDGFYFQKAEPQTVEGENNTWRFEDLAAGAGGKITITGQLVGEKNEEKNFSALMIYRPSNFKNDFQELTNKSITINESVVNVDVEVPLRVQSGEEIEYRVTYKNISSLPLPNVKTLIDYPSGFEVISVSPTPNQQNNVWELESLEQEEEKEIVVRGVINGDSGDNKEFKFQLGLLEPDGKFNLQVEKTSLILIVNPDLELSLTAPEFAQAGEEINYKIKVKNTSDVEIKNVEITLDFLGKQMTQKQAVLDKIESLKAQEEKNLTHKAKVKKKIEGDNLEIKAVANITQAEVEGENVDFEQEAEATTKIKSDFSLSTEARYYAEDLTKLGAGPIPPQVGQKTTYLVFWEVVAGSSDLEGVTVQTTLPEEVFWEGTESENVEYSKTTRQISWNLNQLKSDKNKKISFSVSVTPNPDDLGKLLILTQETVAQATDSYTEENIEEQSKKIDTELETDEAAEGKGVVVGN